jgi:histidyl-tRNA synthetase
VLVLQLDAGLLGDYHRIAQSLRSGGVGAEVYPEAKKLGQQFQYAEKRGHRLAVIVGKDEAANGVVKVKHLANRTEATLPNDAGLAAAVAGLLAAP